MVDLDRDGYDDFYVMARWGANQFFRNRGDGTFEEIASELGLDVEDHSAAAIFADFDNDGDADLFLGRTLARSMYLVNEDGRFVDRSRELAPALPYLVSSVNAADFDQDGLLDLYVSTYAAGPIQDYLNDGEPGGTPLAAWLSNSEQTRLQNEIDSRSQSIHQLAGPPNVLLRNEGGRFGYVDDLIDLHALRNTYQSIWADYDGDGDPDLYLSSDFAANTLYQNNGDGTFFDATESSGTADIGFGMGASFGDYDLDGHQDLYVTNMYSTAGRRITAQFSVLEADYAKSAAGNTLLRSTGEHFEHVSSVEAPGMLVAKAGWGWGRPVHRLRQ